MNDRSDLLLLQSGIFGYINYLVEKDRDYILKTLVNGLSRLEYRMMRLAATRNRLLTVKQVDMIPQVLPSTATPRMRSLPSKRLAKLLSSNNLLPNQSQT